MRPVAEAPDRSADNTFDHAHAKQGERGNPEPGSGMRPGLFPRIKTVARDSTICRSLDDTPAGQSLQTPRIATSHGLSRARTSKTL